MEPSTRPPAAARRRSATPQITEALQQSWREQREDYSAGGVAFRPVEGGHGFEVALIATRGGTRWQLPKGTRELGETSEQTALREVEEEVGLQTTNEAFLKTIEYWYWDTYQRTIPMLVHKQVDFYMLAVVGGVLTDASIEVDSAAWFALDQALDILTFQGEKDVLRAAREWLSRRGEE